VYVLCFTLGVGVCVVLYTVYVYVLYIAMGQGCMRLCRPILLLLSVETI